MSVDYFADAEQGDCPDYGDPRYTFVGRTSTWEHSERSYRLVRDALRIASRDERAVNRFLSDVSLWDRFFDGTVREFRRLFTESDVDISVDSMIMFDDRSSGEEELWNAVITIEGSSWSIDVTIVGNEVSAVEIRRTVY